MNDAERWHHGADLRARIAAHMGAFRRQTHAAPGLRPAAVCLAVAGQDSGGAAVLLTRRPARMARHAGQYALPGGKVDPGETPGEAALRELHEELGVAVGPGQMLGPLDDLPTRSGFLVTPFVVWLDPGTEIVPDPREVAAVFRIPLGDLFAGCGRGENRDLSADQTAGENVFSLFLPSLGQDVFAPTAAILDHFRQVALEGRASRIVRYGEPNFARR